MSDGGELFRVERGKDAIREIKRGQPGAISASTARVAQSVNVGIADLCEGGGFGLMGGIGMGGGETAVGPLNGKRRKADGDGQGDGAFAEPMSRQQMTEA